MIKNKKYTGIKIASGGGRYFRLITQPLTVDEIGLNVIIVINRGRHATPIVGMILKVADFGILVHSMFDVDVLVNPDIVVGWTTQRLYHEDINCPQFQQHPEQFCVPGTFSPEGTVV